MDWPFVIFTLLVLLIIREFKSGSLSPVPHPPQTNVEETNAGNVIVDEATPNRDETGPRPATPSASKDAPSSTPPGDSAYVQNEEKATALTGTQPGKGETVESLQGYTSVLPSAARDFNHAHDFVWNQPITYNINETEEKVLQWLAGSTMSGAEFDARGHVPSCHPGTRSTILENLHKWIDDLQRSHQVFWLHGPAGVGKSTIIQSLAEELAKASKLGASLFFSRDNKRADPALVFPTLAYQLAVRIPRYKEYLRRKMVEDPKLLEKDITQQFDIFIVEPFTNPNFTGECRTWAILLDGLDECEGEGTQVLIVTLISSLSRQYPKFPLVWLVASRPEAHLQHAFASNGIKGLFEEYDVPANSPEGCRDVEKFLRAKFEEIRQKYKDLIPIGVPWPVERDITRISGTSLGLFALAATVVRYIEDPYVCDPISQLAVVVSVTSGLEPGSLSALHEFYSAILDGVPKAMWLILRPLLRYYALSPLIVLKDEKDFIPLVWMATLLGLQQHTVYGALRRLHSVIKIPPPKDSGHTGIRFYHASFPEYLLVVSEDYERDRTELIKWWRVHFKMLYKGDSSSYQRATKGGRPPIPLSWHSHVEEGFRDELWAIGINVVFKSTLQLLHSIEVCRPLFLPATQFQTFFEKFDFSALIFRRHHGAVFPSLFDLADQLVDYAPQDLVQSDLVKRVPLRDLDLGCIPEGKLAHELLWTSHARERDDGFIGPQHRRFYREPQRHDVHHYITAPPESLHLEWHSITQPLENLVAKLERLQGDDPTTQALIVGGGPSKRCVFICVEPHLEEPGHFFYIPYSQ